MQTQAPAHYRYEIKFVLGRTARTAIEAWLARSAFFRRTYPDRIVNSIYYDDPMLSTAMDNIIGIANRRKYRVRSYGKPWDDNATLTLEVKIREGQLGHKLQAPLPFRHSELTRLKGDAVCRLFRDQAATAPHLRHGTELNPTVHISYRRFYHGGPGGIRLTLDDQIAFTDLIGHPPRSRLASRPFESSVMELKFPPARKDIVAELLSGLAVYPTRSSKYVNGLRMFGHVEHV